MDIVGSMGKPKHSEVYGCLCILSVDDDPVNLLVVEQLLEPEGWKVIADLVAFFVCN